MKWVLISLAPVPVVAAFVLGWLIPGAPPAASVAERAGRAPSPAALRDSLDSTAAVQELAAYVGDDHFAPPPSASASADIGGDPAPAPVDESAPPPAPVEAPPAPPPPPPPPPDVGVVFRRQVSAVVTEPGGRLAVLMVDPSSGDRTPRRLRVGDRFEGAWTLISLTRDAAVLSDGGQMRRVPFFGGPVTGEGAIRG